MCIYGSAKQLLFPHAGRPGMTAHPPRPSGEGDFAMGNKPLKPVMDPADLPHMTDAETLHRISVRFRQLSVPGSKGPHVTPGSLMEHVSSLIAPPLAQPCRSLPLLPPPAVAMHVPACHELNSLAQCPKFVDKYGPTIVARVIDMMDTEGSKTASRVVSSRALETERLELAHESAAFTAVRPFARLPAPAGLRHCCIRIVLWDFNAARQA